MQVSIQPLIDLLLYHRQGDNNLFKKLVEQWLSLPAQYEIQISDIPRTAYTVRSNLAALGFIETYQASEVQRWASIGPSAIELEEKESILFLHQYQLDQLPSNSIQHDKLFSIIASKTQSIGLTIPHMFGVIKLDGVSRIKPEFEDLLNILPRTYEAMNDERICNRISELSQDMNLEFYEFENGGWQEAEEITAKGLYRQKPNFGPYRFFIVDKYHKGEIYELLDKAWIYVLAHERLNYPITIKYDPSTKQARIIPRHFFRLPSLLQRILISDSLVFPEYQNGYLVLESIEKKRLDRLGEKMKLLKVTT